jgi:ribonuclease VapC
VPGLSCPVPLDREQADAAVDAWRRFGRGRHQAAPNLGDCFTYALAAATGYPVACVGDDLPATDLAILGR